MRFVVIFLLVMVRKLVIGVKPNNIVWSLNAGGDKHTDSFGIKYNKDPSTVGEASDYGKTMAIGRVAPQDQVLYQTERYHTDDFSYTIPIRDDGDYVLVLKFSEVWFNAPRQKVFDVVLNDEHTIVEGLDIFGKVGRAAAHDEVVTFKVSKNALIIDGRKSPIVGNRVSLTFVKGDFDNPKINAAYLMKGTLADVPTLPPLPSSDPEDEEEKEPLKEPANIVDNIKRKHSSGPKVQDPYAVSDNSSYLMPIIAAVAAFIPLLYCLCKI